MNTELFSFADRLRGRISTGDEVGDFNPLALELFALQFKYNPTYQKICVTRGVAPKVINDWTQIPAVPTAAFKVLELSCIPRAERTAVFHSSGTTEQKPSRHFHRAESLAVYEASLLAGFEPHFGSDKRLTSLAPGEGTGPVENEAHLELAGRLGFLTPVRADAPHSSLVYMFDTVRRRWGLPESAFLGQLAGDGSWAVDFPAVRRQLEAAIESAEPLTLLGTAFSFVHLLDHLAEQGLWFRLPAGSRVMETGGYKNRSRTLPKVRLHELIGERLGVPAAGIVCEYGMSELSSQAYAVALRRDMPGENFWNQKFAHGTHDSRQRDVDYESLAPVPPHPGPLPRGEGESSPVAELSDDSGGQKVPRCMGRENRRQSQSSPVTPVVGGATVHGAGEPNAGFASQNSHSFYFPPWARVQIVSPETGREVADGGVGLIRVFDLANVFSVAAIQTEDLGVRRGGGFELLGRAESAEPRGCSLMTLPG